MSVKFNDYLLSKRTDRASSSVLWFHLANIVVTYIYVKVGIAVAAMPNPNLDGMAFMTLSYAGIVTGNKLVNKYLENRYNVPVQERRTSVERRTKNVSTDVRSNDELDNG